MSYSVGSEGGGLAVHAGDRDLLESSMHAPTVRALPESAPRRASYSAAAVSARAQH